MPSAAGARMLDGERSRPSAMNTQVVWNGTEVESHDLLVAIGRHCTCESAPNGARTRMCAAHEALVRSQRFLDGLLFARRLADRFIAEEWGRPSCTPSTARQYRADLHALGSSPAR
jgi:hypothetical protein